MHNRPLPPVADRSVSGSNVTSSSPLVAAWLERQLLNLANSPYRPLAVAQVLQFNDSNAVGAVVGWHELARS